MSTGELTRQRIPHAWTAVVLVAGALIGVQTGWRWDDGDNRSFNQVDARPECPHDSLIVKLIDDKGNFLRLVNSIPLSDPVSDVPEFHDCQRFVPRYTFLQWFLGNRPRRLLYDSLYAIFAAFRLDTLPKALEGYGAPVATIYSYGGTYEPLGIKPGFNCLVLAGSPGDWEAKMLPQVSWTDSSCEATHIDESGPGTPLVVWESPVPSPDTVRFDRSNFPPAARWDWDGVHQYIGIACGMAWCEIGPAGFSPSPVYQGVGLTFDDIPGLSVTPAQSKQVTRIKGWYDDQQLDSARLDGRHIVTHVRGWLFPNPDLEDVALDDPQSVKTLRGVWVHVATAVLSGNYKANLRSGVNKIYMCHETADAPGRCKGPLMAAFGSPSIPLNQPPLKPPFTRALTACDPDPTDGYRRWWKIQPQVGEARYVCAKRRDHFNDLEQYRRSHNNVRVWIPATARWRWLLEDAGAWHKCETGCCTGQ
jgi:hypothetical protein